MNTPASIRRHPIHPMLVVFPIAFWIGSLVCDIIYHVGSHDMFWKVVAFYSMAGGIIAALLAAIPGFIDYLSLTDPRTKKIATTHLALNLMVVVLFIFNLGLRYNASTGTAMFEVVLSIIAIAILAASGWLGGILVYEHRVGVSTPREERVIDRRAA
jgi:uncharacterized membrane protein